MTGRRLAAGRYGFDDLAEGDWLETEAKTVTAEAIDAFAALSGDRFEIHMDDEAARGHGFPGRVTHGLLVLSLVDGLKNRAPAQFRTIASLGWDWSFHRPVLIGHRLRARITVEEKRPVRKADRGILKLRFDVTDQEKQETLQEGSNLLLVYR